MNEWKIIHNICNRFIWLQKALQQTAFAFSGFSWFCNLLPSANSGQYTGRYTTKICTPQTSWGRLRMARLRIAAQAIFGPPGIFKWEGLVIWHWHVCASEFWEEGIVLVQSRFIVVQFESSVVSLMHSDKRILGLNTSGCCNEKFKSFASDKLLLASIICWTIF